MRDTLNTPAYVRQAASLIKKSLQEGCDVVDLGNGDITTTETITIVNRYKWNQDTGKLVKVKDTVKNQVKKSEFAEEAAAEPLPRSIAA